MLISLSLFKDSRGITRYCTLEYFIVLLRTGRIQAVTPAKELGGLPRGHHVMDRRQISNAQLRSVVIRLSTSRHEKKGETSFENHPPRQYPARTWNRNKSYNIKLVDVVSPTDGTGHPQLTSALRDVSSVARARVART